MSVTAAVLAALFIVSLFGWRGRASADETQNVKVPVIMYHHILKEPSRWGDYVISPEEFEEDLRYLAEEGYTAVTATQLIGFVKYGLPLPEKPVVLSFDDGHRSFYAYAYPLLKQYDQKAVVAIVGEYSESYSVGEDHNVAYAYLSWDEIAELSASGYAEIQNHTWAMHDNTGRRNGVKRLKGESAEEYAAVLAADLGRLQDKLEEITGVRPNTFVYPFGAVSEGSAEILRELGFEAAFDCESKLNLLAFGDDEALMRIHRANRRHGRSARQILEKLVGQ